MRILLLCCLLTAMSGELCAQRPDLPPGVKLPEIKKNPLEDYKEEGGKKVFRVEGRELLKDMEKRPTSYRVRKSRSNYKLPPELMPEEEAAMTAEEITKYNNRRKMFKLLIKQDEARHMGRMIMHPDAVVYAAMHLTNINKKKGTCQIISMRTDLEISSEAIEEIEEKRLRGEQYYKCRVICEEGEDPVLRVYAVSNGSPRQYLPVFVAGYDPEKLEVYNLDSDLLVECASKKPDLFLKKFGLKTKGFVTEMILTDFTKEDSTALISESEVRVKIDEKHFREGAKVAYQYQLKKGEDHKLLIEVRGINDLTKLTPLR
ncbi:hypothetical protein SAMN02745181_3426 [Rubritalea squalenifaciens DSM 18772]|uniref:Uncharacterized protein n=2 Tax=Rubritalea squalenifaciens TaxID=407226 RepID=A0A1M6QKR2_9BACT|nr:hypothetical protein SAMN02745181_3426 [Rubritalea squalenifaciens DSM 18772]